MNYNIPNLYIANRNRDGQDAALATRVSALELTVDGDSTATPPVPGLEDTVGDLVTAVGNLDMTVNGDTTTTPATPGLVDRVEALELIAGNAYIFTQWTNADPTQSMSNGDEIELISDDYNMLMWIVRGATNLDDVVQSLIIPKGADAFLSRVSAGSDGTVVYKRVVSRTTDTKYTAQSASYATGTTAATTANNSVIPLVIYGIKILGGN